MGALLSQAVANQLRQVPGFMDPHPSPPTLIQQVLNPPGPSRPMWMAPVMENQQALATSMAPGPYQRALNESLGRSALEAGIAFGGADITKEERLKWEKENAEHRAKLENRIPTGTRVRIAHDIEDRSKWLNKATNRARFLLNNGYWPKIPISGEEGEVLEGTANASQVDALRQGYHMVRVPSTATPERPNGDTFAVHRDSLEVLRPHESMPPGTYVDYVSPHNGVHLFEAEVIDPASVGKNTGDRLMDMPAKNPGPDYVLVHAPAIPGKQARFRAWVKRSELEVRKKK